jgi:hypothetical protein
MVAISKTIERDVKKTLFARHDKTSVEDKRAVVTYSINLSTAYDSTSNIRTQIFGQRQESDRNLLFSIHKHYSV